MRLLDGGDRWPDRSRSSIDTLAEIDAAFRPADQAALVVDTIYGVESQPVSADASAL